VVDDEVEDEVQPNQMQQMRNKRLQKLKNRLYRMTTKQQLEQMQKNQKIIHKILQRNHQNDRKILLQIQIIP
jgi:hypothetical protein